MSNKSRGINKERDVVNFAEEQGYNALRVAGSGSAPIPLPDIVIGKQETMPSLEHKYGESPLYIGKDEVRQLIQFTQLWCGAEPWLCARFKGDTTHYVARPEWLPTTEKSYVFNQKHIEQDKTRYNTLKELIPKRENSSFNEDDRQKRRKDLKG